MICAAGVSDAKQATGETMAKIERKHEVIDGPLTEEVLRSKAKDGWRALAVVWERTVEGEEEDTSTEAVPYGLRVASDCMTLEPAVDEIKVMIHMLKMIVDDKGFGQIAAELHEAGFRTRLGGEWNQTSVFKMLPRLIEVAPSIYSSDDWLTLKPHLTL